MRRRVFLAAVASSSAPILAGCLSSASYENYFPACSMPDVSSQVEMLPPSKPFDDLERRTTSFNSDMDHYVEAHEYGSDAGTHAAAVIKYHEQPDPETYEIDVSVGGGQVDVSVFVIIEEYVFLSGGPSEERARTLLGTFPGFDDGCVDSAIARSQN